MSEPLQFRMHGMDCADEVAILRSAVGPTVGSPERLSFDLLRGKMIVTLGGFANLLAAITAGMGISVVVIFNALRLRKA